MAWQRQAASAVTGEPPVPAPEATLHRVPAARPADNWRVLDGVKRCQYAGGPGRPHCREAAVAEFNRKVRLNPRRAFRTTIADRWWAYCGTHTNHYGRWVVGDRVLEWRLVPREETP